VKVISTFDDHLSSAVILTGCASTFASGRSSQFEMLIEAIADVPSVHELKNPETNLVIICTFSQFERHGHTTILTEYKLMNRTFSVA
jgi:hypothetical protein